MISGLFPIVYHPNVALTVVRCVVALVMIVVIAVVVLVVSHCVCPFFIVEYFIWKRQQENPLACFWEYSIMNPRFWKWTGCAGFEFLFRHFLHFLAYFPFPSKEFSYQISSESNQILALKFSKKCGIINQNNKKLNRTGGQIER